MSAPNLTQALERSGPYSPQDVSSADARAVWAEYRRAAGYGAHSPILTPPEANVKLHKSVRPSYGLTLAPAESSGFNVCQWSTPGCRAVCVITTAGKGPIPSVLAARILRTRFLAEHPAEAIALIGWELERAVRKHGAINMRLNVGSDLRWERFAPALLQTHGVTFYDYTKAPRSQRDRSESYALTYSLSERRQSHAEAIDYLRDGGNVAAVFATVRGHALPATFAGFPVVDGDLSDDRTLDPAGSVIGLRAKGSARGTVGGFIQSGEAT